MAFSFGSTSTPAFGSAAQKPTGFATPFGATAATTQSTGFGFGQTQATPAFGQTQATPAFGQTQAAPAFGSTFGAQPTSAPPTFGSSTFGATTSSAAPVFGSTFGSSTSTASAFGTAQTPGTGLFGAATTKPSLFGAPTTSTTNLFGNTATSTPSLFGGAQTTQSAPSLFGNTGTGTSLFGQSAPTTAASAPFGGSLFGAPAQSTALSIFNGSTFGTNTISTGGFGGFGTNTTGAFGGFGTSATGGGLFGPKPQPTIQQAPQQTPQNKNQQVIASVYAINVFNDERDDILKKWNMLQACWGTGKGYYSASQPPVEYTPQNPFYRFKAMGYNVIPEQDNSEGLVKLVFNKKIADLRNQQDVLKNGIGGILGNRPNLTVEIVMIKAMTDNLTEVKISVSEKGVTGTSRKIPATELAAFLNQPTQKQQLTNVGVSSITPFVTPSKAELEDYLKQPPAGIDQQMWQAAIQDNPNPKKYIPVPINGFSDLRSRMLNQEYQTGLHSAFLERVGKDITDLKTKHAASIAQITELKQKFLELQHRILRVLVKQESTRKVGLAIQPEEEILRGRLEVMHAQLNVPKQFKGQINELLSHVKMIESTSKQSENQYRIDADAQDEIKQFLKMEQNGISQLISIINNDAKALKIITEGLKELAERRHFR